MAFDRHSGMTTTQRPGPDRRDAVFEPPVRGPRPRSIWPFDLYRSAIGKKYAMAITGMVFMAYVVAHTLGNLKLYLGSESMNRYAEWLRQVGEPALPATTVLWILRVLLIVCLVVHVHATWSLTRINRRARPTSYASKRNYQASDFASRTMRWGGVIVLLFIAFHLLDLTWGTANPGHIAGDPYQNVVTSFQRVPVSVVYIVANLALGLHLYHGAWSLFQSMGWNNPRINLWRRGFAIAFAALIVIGNISFPLAVLSGVVG